MIRKILLFCFLWIGLGSAVVRAQDPVGNYISGLGMPDAAGGARVSVQNDPSVSAALKGAAVPAKVPGYRVCLFSDISQSARASATATKARFEELFGGLSAAIVYNSPAFKVIVGDCLNLTEATMLWGRVKEAFPQATIVRESIPVETFAGPASAPASQNSTTLVPQSPENLQ